MRTNIEIDDKLMKQAMKASGATTKKAVVELALKRLVQGEKRVSTLRSLRGVLKNDADWVAPPGGKDKWAEAADRYAAEDKARRKTAA